MQPISLSRRRPDSLASGCVKFNSSRQWPLSSSVRPTISMQIDPPLAYVKDTGTVRGRGVFAARGFKSGETVEICPVIVVSKLANDLPQEVGCVLFGWSYLVTRQVGPQTAVALGYGSLYNHNNPANMRYEADDHLKALRFIAVRDIAQDEELTVNYNAYGGGPEWDDNKWFENKGITPIVKSGGASRP
jgi:hypothetical protein